MTDEEKAEQALKLRKLDAENAHLIAQTMKINEEARWCEFVIVSAATLAIAALANAIFK